MKEINKKEKEKSLNKSHKVIFHIDVNNAFLSWTALDLLKKGYPEDIRKIPSVISGSEAHRSGFVVAKSIPAKKIGINTCDPNWLVLKKCPDTKFFEPDHSLYEEKSNELFNLFLKYTNIVEKYSVDESFLDVTDFLFGNTPLELAKKIQQDIFTNLGYTVNIGISDCKLLAKTASDFEKPNKIHVLYSWEIQEKLWPLDIQNLFYVGKKLQNELKKLQITTIGDLANYNREIILKRFGKFGKTILNLANGIDNSSVEYKEFIPKSISNAQTFNSDTSNIEVIKWYMMQITEHCAFRLREKNLKCKTIRLTLRDENFNEKSKQITLDDYTSSTSDIYDTANTILNSLFKNQKVRLLSLALDNLHDNKIHQITLFDDDKENIKKEKIDKTLDHISNKYGEGIVRRARNLKKK